MDTFLSFFHAKSLKSAVYLKKQKPVLCGGRKISETATHSNTEDGKSTSKLVDLAKEIPERNVGGVSYLLSTVYKVILMYFF